MGAASAFAAFAGLEIDNRNRSLTPAKQRTCSVEEEQPVEPITLPLGDVVSVDQEVPSRRRSSSVGSDFFSSVASDTGSAQPPPPPSNSIHGKSALYRIFLHTSSHGYIEFNFDTPNSHDILMAFLSAHLKPNQLPRKTPNVIPPLDGALQTMVLTPTTIEKRVPSISNLHKPPRLTRSNSMDSACTLDKLQKKIIQQRIQQESTPLEKIKEKLSSLMSNIDLSLCCQDTTVATDQDEKRSPAKRGIVASGDETPDTKTLKKKGIGGLSFEESISLTPKLSFEKSVMTDRSNLS
jgi:hypothetical protein